MKVFLVVDTHNAPGRVLAIFADEEDADLFADALSDSCDVESRTLWYGQPPNRGFNE